MRMYDATVRLPGNLSAQGFLGRRLRRRDARVHRAMGSAPESSREDPTHRSSDSRVDWQFSKEPDVSRPAAPIFIGRQPQGSDRQMVAVSVVAERVILALFIDPHRLPMALANRKSY